MADRGHSVFLRGYSHQLQLTGRFASSTWTRLLIDTGIEDPLIVDELLCLANVDSDPEAKVWDTSEMAYRCRYWRAEAG